MAHASFLDIEREGARVTYDHYLDMELRRFQAECLECGRELLAEMDLSFWTLLRDARV